MPMSPCLHGRKYALTQKAAREKFPRLSAKVGDFETLEWMLHARTHIPAAM